MQPLRAVLKTKLSHTPRKIMKLNLTLAALITSTFLLIPSALALNFSVSNGGTTNIGNNEILSDFGMITGGVKFNLGGLEWTPEEIWLIPEDIDPYIFSKGLTQETVLQLPDNVTFSTCRTGVYYNESSGGYGFKIFNTGTTTQILSNGTFCGLAYTGNYFVFAKY